MLELKIMKLELPFLRTEKNHEKNIGLAKTTQFNRVKYCDNFAVNNLSCWMVLKWLSWNAFFVQAIADFLLKDEVSPGEIDKDEAAWLVEKIGADGQVDGTERTLLEKLKAEAKSFPANLAAMI